MRGWLPWLLLSACAGSSPGPFFGDERYLRFGVDPDAEAKQVVAHFERAGRRKQVQLRGRHFTALGFVDARGEPAAVRVLTARGIALALDSREGDALQPAQAFNLLAPPQEGHDADADGFEEVFVLRRQGGRGCIEAFRIRDVGFVDPVSIEPGALQGCAQELADVDADGVLELLVMLRYPIEGLSEVPQVHIPLFAADHRFSPNPEHPAFADFVAVQRAARQGSLSTAARSGQGERALRIAVELAALEAFSQAPSPDPLAALEQALAQAALAPELEPLADTVRDVLPGLLPGNHGQEQETKVGPGRAAGVPQSASPQEL